MDVSYSYSNDLNNLLITRYINNHIKRITIILLRVNPYPSHTTFKNLNQYFEVEVTAHNIKTEN